MPHLNNKQTKIQTQSSADRITTSFSLTHQRKKKQTKNSAQISPYTKKFTQTSGPNLGWKKPKGKKDFNLEAQEKEISNTISLKKKVMKR